MANRKRNVQIHFFVSEEEYKLIRRKMLLAHTRNMGAYLRKIAINGAVINADVEPLKKQYYEMSKIGANINQIAKRINETGAIYQNEMNEIQEMVKQIWHILKSSPLRQL